jgi:hypothetical protein
MNHMRLVCACRVAPRVPWHMPRQREMVLLLAVIHELDLKSTGYQAFAVAMTRICGWYWMLSMVSCKRKCFGVQVCVVSGALISGGTCCQCRATHRLDYPVDSTAPYIWHRYDLFLNRIDTTSFDSL